MCNDQCPLRDRAHQHKQAGQLDPDFILARYDHFTDRQLAYARDGRHDVSVAFRNAKWRTSGYSV